MGQLYHVKGVDKLSQGRMGVTEWHLSSKYIFRWYIILSCISSKKFQIYFDTYFFVLVA